MKTLGSMLCLFFCLYFFSPSAHALQCRSLYKPITRSFDVRLALQERNIDPEQVHLVFKREHIQEEGIHIQFEFYHRNSLIGEMTVWTWSYRFGDFSETSVRWSDYQIWRTDTSGIHAQQGQGLGQIMYLLMAAKFFNSYPNKRLVSPDHSGSANHMWEALVRKDFATRFGLDPNGRETKNITEQTGTIYEIEASAIGPSLRQFVRPFPIEKL